MELYRNLRIRAREILKKKFHFDMKIQSGLRHSFHPNYKVLNHGMFFDQIYVFSKDNKQINFLQYFKQYNWNPCTKLQANCIATAKPLEFCPTNLQASKASRMWSLNHFLPSAFFRKRKRFNIFS